MMDPQHQEHTEAVRRYVVTAGPVTATTRGGAYKKAWQKSKLDIHPEKFRYILREFGWKPVPVGELWTLEFRGAGS